MRSAIRHGPRRSACTIFGRSLDRRLPPTACCLWDSPWPVSGGPIRSLWFVPLLTWMMVITRIRNIAEHAVVRLE